MKFRGLRLFRRMIMAILYSAVGALVVLISGFVVFLNNQADLYPWHLAKLDQEFTVESGVNDFEEYLALEKLAWNAVLPEYDPYKYNSFAVNAGDVAYQLTKQIQNRLTTLSDEDRLKDMPPIPAFASVVDATVSTPALVDGLFARLPSGGHELVLFDINHRAEIRPLVKWNPAKIVQALQAALIRALP